MQSKTTNKRLQERYCTPQAISSSEESFNSTSLQNAGNSDSPMPSVHSGSGYNLRKESRISTHSVFVLGVDGKPLTPTTKAKAKKLLKGNQAKPVWNKFSQFGIQMLVLVGNKTPKTALGVDFGTKFEGYSVAVGKENNFNAMWLLPDKKKNVNKITERKQLRRARRFRNCRRRECRGDNRSKKGFIAPSQFVIVQSRIKAISEFFKCYPLTAVAMEDVRFNHSKHRWGKNFSTVEIGKKYINDWIRERAHLSQYNGYDTQGFREAHGYKKSSHKNAKIFDSHCSDSLAIATDLFYKQHIPQGTFVVVDDTYRPVRRKLHDTQPAKGGVRDNYSTGNFKGIRKGTVCEYGQIVGGTKNNIWIRNNENKRIGKSVKKVNWLSHHFKNILAIPPPNEFGGILAR